MCVREGGGGGGVGGGGGGVSSLANYIANIRRVSRKPRLRLSVRYVFGTFKGNLYRFYIIFHWNRFLSGLALRKHAYSNILRILPPKMKIFR